MKKLSFLFAMVFAVSMAMGQKTTWVDQSGNGNLADVTQTACVSGDATSIFAVQSGDFNELFTTQTGNNNYLELKQTGYKNTAMMEQFTCDAGELPGGVNNADIYQSGNSNTANLTQEEDNITGDRDYGNNTANATQSGDYNSYILTQGTRTAQPVNAQYLKQLGDGNSADVDQIGLTQYSEIVQKGDWNTADLYQKGKGGASSSWNKSYSWQLGHKNMLDIMQEDNPKLELVESVQNGTSNTTNVTQKSEWIQDVYSKQKGTGDIINVTQID